MVDLFNKYKDCSPSPKGQMTIDHFERLRLIADKERERCAAKDILQCFIAAVCFVIGIFAAAFTFYNIYEYNQSFDRCEALLEQIHANTAILDQEINELRSSMGEVDYE